MPDQTQLSDRKTRLYSLLVDQIQRYNALLWQIPVALFAANMVALKDHFERPWISLGAAIFNWAIIFTFFRMTRQQRVIIDTARRAEAELRAARETDAIPSVGVPAVNEQGLAAFVPFFPDNLLKASDVVTWTLIILNLLLTLYALCPIFHTIAFLTKCEG